MKINIKKTSIIIITLLVISLSLTYTVAVQNNSNNSQNTNITLNDISIKVPTTTTKDINKVNDFQIYSDKTNQIKITATTTGTIDNPFLINKNACETVDNYIIYNETINGQTVYTGAVSVNNRQVFAYAQNKDQLLNILKSIDGGKTMRCDSTSNAMTNIQTNSVKYVDTDEYD